jgi:hypothetical protein
VNEPADVDAQAVDETNDSSQPVDAESLTPAERAAALERRAGERGPAGPRGRAVVLGMHIQEGANQRVKVVEVSAASPAFDAGVRAGDEIVSVDGFHAKTYREWIDGIRRMVTDTPDGEMIVVELLRNRKRVTVQIRAPESRADDPRLPGLLEQPIPAPGGPASGSTAPSGPNTGQALSGRQVTTCLSTTYRSTTYLIRRVRAQQTAQSPRFFASATNNKPARCRGSLAPPVRGRLSVNNRKARALPRQH